MENLNNLGKFGNNPEDIQEILLERPLNDNGKEVEALYVKYNDGTIVRTDRGDMTPNEFFKQINYWMVKSLELKPSDRGAKWNALINNEANKAKFSEFTNEEEMVEEASDELDLSGDENIIPSNVVVAEDASAKKYKLQRNAVIGLAVGLGLLGLGGYAASKNSNKNAPATQTEITIDTNNVVENEEDKAIVKSFSGYYANDLMGANDFEEVLAKYDVNASSQLTRSNTLLNTAKNFNRKVTLLDGTVVNGGLTVEQLGAVEIYSNIDKYSDIELVKRTGLMDYSNVASDFRKAADVTAAMFADKEVSGEALADLFENETVKEFYLKLDDFRLRVLNAETEQEKTKITNEINKFFEDTFSRVTDNYINYSENPGVAFAITAEVNAMDLYNNVKLDKKYVQDLIIVGKDDVMGRSQLDQICASANEKLDSAIELVDSMKLFIDTIDYSEISLDNLDAISKDAIAKFASVDFENMSDMEKVNVRDVLSTNRGLAAFVVNHSFSQEKLNMLMNASLAKEDKLVNSEDQESIIKNAILVQIEKVKSAENGRFANEKTKKIAQQLQKPGDTYKEEAKQVQYTGDAANKLEETHPEETEKAKEEENKKKGLDDASTSEKKEEVQKKIDKEVEETAKVGQNYVDQVVAYYQTHGDVAGIPAELQAAYNDLGEAIFNTAKSTGIARYNRDHNPKNFGGDITINPEYVEIEVTDVNPSEVKEETKEEKKEETKTQSTVDVKTEVKVTPEAKTETTTETKTEVKVTPSTTEETKTEVKSETTTETKTETKTETSSTSFGGDIVINPEWEDFEITDISTDPEMVGLNSEADVDAYIESLSSAADAVEESSFTLK